MSNGFNVYFSANSWFLKYKSGILQGYKMKNILGLFHFARRFAIRFHLLMQKIKRQN